jgi:hypothetical protein
MASVVRSLIYMRQESWEAAVKAATSALEEDPNHHKALWRRAKANEAIDSWSSLVSAQKGVLLSSLNTLVLIVTGFSQIIKQ